jgi:hypothetical protein
MAKTETIYVKDLRRLYSKVQKKMDKVLKRPFKDTRSMFTQLALMIDDDTMKTFKNQGEHQGRKRWPDFGRGQGVDYYRNPNTGLYAIRYGTTLKGRERGTYKPGVKRPGFGSKKRYNSSSQLLQASGAFRLTFGIQKLTMKSMRYGTRHKLAEQIMSDPARPTIQLTKKDEKRYGSLIIRYIKGKL